MRCHECYKRRNLGNNRSTEHRNKKFLLEEVIFLASSQKLTSECDVYVSWCGGYWDLLHTIFTYNLLCLFWKTYIAIFFFFFGVAILFLFWKEKQEKSMISNDTANAQFRHLLYLHISLLIKRHNLFWETNISPREVNRSSKSWQVQNKSNIRCDQILILDNVVIWRFNFTLQFDGTFMARVSFK